MEPGNRIGTAGELRLLADGVVLVILVARGDNGTRAYAVGSKFAEVIAVPLGSSHFGAAGTVATLRIAFNGCARLRCMRHKRVTKLAQRMSKPS